MSVEKLKPCPFCGNEYISVVPAAHKCVYWCKCEECGVSTNCLDDKQKAIDFWNRRVGDES